MQSLKRLSAAAVVLAAAAFSADPALAGPAGRHIPGGAPHAGPSGSQHGKFVGITGTPGSQAGARGNAEGAARGLDRANQVAGPHGQKGRDNAAARRAGHQ